MIGRTKSDKHLSLRFWFLAAFIVFVFLIGGASRADSIYLLVLRPVAILVCGAAIIALPKGALGSYKTLAWLGGAIIALPLLQLIPLPPGLAHLLPGHGLIADIDKAAGIDAWRCITMVPSATRNALFSLSVPLAAFLLGISIPREEQQRILPIVLILGLVSALIGLLQAVGTSSSPLYFHELSNDGSAIGLFVNRNHHAYFLAGLFVMIGTLAAVYARTPQAQSLFGWIALVVAIAMIPFILITGSRSGLAVALVGILAGGAAYRLGTRSIRVAVKKRSGMKSYLAYVGAAVAACVLVMLSIMFSRAMSIERLAAPGQLDDLRFSLWMPTLEAARSYFPFGSGMGSFVEVYQIQEAHDMLGLSYINHAHNDWLEMLMTGGLLGGAVLAVIVVAWAMVSAKVWLGRGANSTDDIYARLGSTVLLLFAIGSFSDYPLRTPSIMVLAVMAALWMNVPFRLPAKSPLGSEK
ncbi:O-antigen ligase [Sphingomonas sp. SUN039]|uniref:O-antigen ligase family protein n=1 Tax=Sphingomonas sp. SUN039 TaxID=2937787 RepID=UPI0021649C64|nr:O-antigen ligase family protein [Sphingomonas sp. SUN039]UVO52862.1 O-antigen ligase family protein [Sphingomonas sp. SUN039]